MPSVQLPRAAATPTPVPQGVRLDAGALAAGARGLQQLGAGIADVGDALTQQAMQAQQHINQGYLAQQDLAREDAMATIEQFATANPDKPESWEAHAKEVWQGYHDRRAVMAEEQGWGDDVRRADDQRMAAFEQKANIIFTENVQKAQIRQANDALFTQAERAFNSGRENAYSDGMAYLGRMTLTAQQRADAQQKLVMSGAYGDVRANPAAAIDALEEKDKAGNYTRLPELSEQQRYSLIQTARGQLTQNRADYQNSVAERRFAGEVIGDAELSQAVAAGNVTAAWAKNFTKQQAKDIAQDIAEPTAAFYEVLNAVDVFDPRVEGNAGYAKLMGQITLLPARLASDAQERLKVKMGDPKSPLNSDAFKEAAQRSEELFPAPKIEQFSGESGRNAALLAYAERDRLMANLRAYVQVAPGQKPRTPEEVLGEFNRLAAPKKAQAVSAAVSAKLPGTPQAARQAQADADLARALLLEGKSSK